MSKFSRSSDIIINSDAGDGATTTRFADLVRNGFFLLEAKDAESGESTDLLLRRAFGQAAQYTAFLKEGQPPYLLVLDVGATLRNAG